MHRFESVQHLARHTDERHEYFNTNHPNPSVPNTTFPHNQGFGVRASGMSSSHQGAMGGKGNQPNPRMPGFPGPGNSSMEGGNPHCPSPLYNNYRNHQMPYHQGGIGMPLEGMGYLAQKRNNQMMASGQYGGGSMGAEGYGASGVGAARFHPYQPQIQHQAPQPPQQPQPQRSGFLEQLLKNRGSTPQPYGKPSMGMPPSTLNSYPGGHPGFRGISGPSGWNNYYQGMTYGPGGAGGGRAGPGYIPTHHQPPQWGRGNMGGGAFQPYNPHLNNAPNFNNHVNYQSNYSNLHQNNPFNHSRHLQQQQLPVIINEPEEEDTPSAQEQADAEIRKSEARFQKNHERMHTILNETMANCDPIKVPMSRVETLRRHVKLLNEDVSKHKEDKAHVKDQCAKRLQDFKESTAKFHSDYNKLCEPMESEEFDALVDKYYNELKEKLNNGSTSLDGTIGAELVMDGNLGFDDFLFMRQEMNIQTKVSDEGLPALGDSNTVCNNQAEYYENPLFIDIPPESEPRFEESAYPTPHLSQNADLCYGGIQGHGQQHQPQQQMADCMYYGGEGNHGDLSTTTQQQLTAQQPMRWNQNTNPSVNNFGHVQTQRQQYNIEEEGFPSHHPHPQAGSMLRQLRPNRQTRPSEELREFVKGLVIAQQQGKLRNELLAQNQHHQQVPQLEQEGLAIEQQQHPSAQDGPDDGQGQHQQRRLMSGGGIVEVKYSPPLPNTSQSTLYDDDATREWINSLTSSVTDESNCEAGGNIGADASQQGMLREGGIENDDYNNNMDNPILDGIGESPLSQVSGGLLGKNSKLAEILESPCLNDNNDEEFESELRQLEDALNASSQVDEINKQEINECAGGHCSEVDEGELVEGQENIE